MNLIAEQENLEKLGRRIQAMREMRQMSALKLAAELESSLTSVRDWEMGSRKLQPATIRRLAETLSVSYPEEIYWLGLAGHIPTTRMPVAEQIIMALNVYYNTIKDLPFPAQVVDHQFNYWVINPATVDFLGSRDQIVFLMQNQLNALDVIFNTHLGFITRVSKPETLIVRQKQLARRIMGRCLLRRHERFYQEYPRWLQDRIDPTDFQTFSELWEEVNEVKDSLTQNPQLEDDILLNYFDFEYPDGRFRPLQMRADHLRHFGDIFEILLFHPYGNENLEDWRLQAREGVKLWEVADVQQVLRHY
jgi:transcriptional regulator with XRE-family HTH domain